jgi:hypothetical protein
MKKYITPEILQTGMILGGLFLVYRLLRPAGAKEQQQTTTSIKTDIQKEAAKGEQPSYSDSNYKTLADKLYSAMNTSGTNLSQIYSVFEQMKNKIDVLKLIEAYGVRQLYTFGVPTGGQQNLAQALSDELNDMWPFEELKKINQILFKKGINYKF